MCPGLLGTMSSSLWEPGMNETRDSREMESKTDLLIKLLFNETSVQA